MPDLEGKHILIFAGDDYEDMELQYPKYRLLEAGAEVIIAGLQAGVTVKGKYGYPQKVSVAVGDIDPDDLDGLVIPGGWMPDKLRRDPHVLAITRAVHEAGKPVASICHGPQIDISAGIVRGATYTSTPAIKDDLINAGATWVDQPVCVDGHHITSRRPDDLPQFCEAILEVFSAMANAG